MLAVSTAVWGGGELTGASSRPTEGGVGLLGSLGVMVLCHGEFGSWLRGLIQAVAKPTREGLCPHSCSLPQFLPSAGMVPLV